MRKITLIKKIMGTQLSNYGFHYYKKKPNTWVFSRKYKEVDQFVAVYESNFSQSIRLELYTSIDMFRVFEISDFVPYWEEQYGEKDFWDYKNEDDFIEILKEFVDVIESHGLKALEELSIPTRESGIEITLEMHQELFENRDSMCKHFIEKYGVTFHNLKQGIDRINQILKENKDTNYEVMKKVLLELAAYYGEAIVIQFNGTWLLDEKLNTSKIEIKKEHRTLYSFPLQNILSAWTSISESENILFLLYNDLFIE